MSVIICLVVADQGQLYEQVLAESIRSAELTEQQAVDIVRRALFENSNNLYKLGLMPDVSLGWRAWTMRTVIEGR